MRAKFPCGIRTDRKIKDIGGIRVQHHPGVSTENGEKFQCLPVFTLLRGGLNAALKNLMEIGKHSGGGIGSAQRRRRAADQHAQVFRQFRNIRILIQSVVKHLKERKTRRRHCGDRFRDHRRNGAETAPERIRIRFPGFPIASARWILRTGRKVNAIFCNQKNDDEKTQAQKIFPGSSASGIKSVGSSNLRQHPAAPSPLWFERR